MTTGDVLRLDNRHTGEHLELQRFVDSDGRVSLRLRGTLPPHREGPPLHVHFAQEEVGQVTAGTLTTDVDGTVQRWGPGDQVTLPAGVRHRWWNDGDELLAFTGVARPAVDLDLYLQAVFEVINASPSGRPSLFHLAHITWRHRRTQAVLVMPSAVAAVVMPVVVLVGAILGRYRGTSWPGAPARYSQAPLQS